jgi:hypothetical protein
LELGARFDVFSVILSLSKEGRISTSLELRLWFDKLTMTN